MSLTVPNDGSVMHIANVTCAVCSGKQNRSMLNMKAISDIIFQEILKRIAPVCRRCEVKSNCVMLCLFVFFLRFCS